MLQTTLQQLRGIIALAVLGVLQNRVLFREKDSRLMQKYRLIRH